MRRSAAVTLGGFLIAICGAACSSTSEPSSGPGSSGGSSSGSGGGDGGAGSSSGSGGASSSGGGSGGGSSSSGGGGSSSGGGSSGGGSDAGGEDAGDSGAPSDAGTDSGVPPGSSFTCNTVLGIDTTSEWYTSGFESQVNDGRWQIIYHHPGYVADWANPNDAVWSTAATSPCSTNSNNPDRVIFNAFADPTLTTYKTESEWVAGLTTVVQNLKQKFSGLRRIDLLTMTRAPNNQPCVTGNRASVVETYVDSAIMTVVAANPNLVTASPKFFAPDCSVFTSGGPHFTTAGKPIVAKIYGDYYSTEP